MANTVHVRSGLGDTSYLQNAIVLGEMDDLGVSRTQNSDDTSKAEVLDTIHDSPELGDSDVSDAETLSSSRSLELIDLGCIDSRPKEAPQLDIDLGSSESSEEENSD